MSTDPSLARSLTKGQRIALTLGLAAGLLSLVGVFLSPVFFFQAYLFAFVFWVCMSLGCFGLALLHQLAGGRWGAVLIRFLEAGMSTLPLMLVLFIPLIAGVYILYPWSNASTVAQDAVVAHQSVYLNAPFFVIRSLVYFAVWILLARQIHRWSLALDLHPSASMGRRMRTVGALGIVALGLTSSFAMIDWVMSLESHWYSTIYPMMVMMGAVLAAFAFVVFIVALLDTHMPLSQVLAPGLFNDLGSLLLAFVMLWAYLAFSQFLLIYSGNLDSETPWYVGRLQGGWEWIAFAVALCNFVLPFVFLLFRDLKRNPRLLAVVAGVLVVARVVDVFWLVQPSFSPAQLSASWLHPVLFVAVGGLWLAWYARQLSRHALLPRRDRAVIPAGEGELVHERT